MARLQPAPVELKIRDPVTNIWVPAELTRLDLHEDWDMLEDIMGQRRKGAGSNRAILDIECLQGPFTELCGHGEHPVHLLLGLADQVEYALGLILKINHHFAVEEFSTVEIKFSLTPTENPDRKPKMPKIENIAIIANDNVTTLKAAFSWAGNNDKPYTFKVERSLAETLKADDAVVVDSKNGLSVARVISVDEFSDVEPDSDVDFRWAFQKVERPELDRLIAEEGKIVTQLKTAQRENIKAAALKGLGIEAGTLQIGGATPAAETPAS